MARYCQLGNMLPASSDFDTDDAAAVAEAKMVVAEMNKAKSEMDRLLELEAAARQKGAKDNARRAATEVRWAEEEATRQAESRRAYKASLRR